MPPRNARTTDSRYARSHRAPTVHKQCSIPRSSFVLSSTSPPLIAFLLPPPVHLGSALFLLLQLDNLFPYPSTGSSVRGPVELLINKMQEQIDVDLGSPAFSLTEQIHKLMIIKLRRQTILKRDLRTRSRDHHTSHTTLHIKHPDLITANRDINLLVLFFRVSRPGDEHAFVPKIARRVFEGAEFRLATSAREGALVVVLAREGEEETFLSIGPQVSMV